MARPTAWYEKSGGFGAQTGQMATEIITEAQMEDLTQATITRIILWPAFKNGSTANNVLHWGLLVTDARTAATDYPDPKDDGHAALGWIQKGFYAFETADALGVDVTPGALPIDIRVQRKIRRGQVLVFIADDTAGDYDKVGIKARVLMRM